MEHESDEDAVGTYCDTIQGDHPLNYLNDDDITVVECDNCDK